jgi:hypothetical protein
VYYKVNNAYAISPKGVGAVVLNKGVRNFTSDIMHDAAIGTPEAITSRFAINRAKAMLLRDVVACNWFVGAKGDSSSYSSYKFAQAKPQVGCDPEVFLGDGDKLIPAFDVLPSKAQAGTSPFFWDGFQAECVPAKSECIQILLTNLQEALLQMRKHVRAKRPNADFLAQDAVGINPKGVKPEHLAIGCDPSLNLYGVGGDLPADPSKLPWRFAGGHIHFGDAGIKDSPNKARDAAKIVRDLDKILAVWSVGAFGAFERNKVRRRYYGLAGEFRLPPHGLEYRTLSNGWLASPEVAQLTFELARAVFQLSKIGLLDFWYGDEETTQGIVNNYDVELARRILRHNEKLFIRIVAAANENFQLAKGGPEHIARKALQVGLEGVECAVENPLAITRNWLLEEYDAIPLVYGSKPTRVRAGWRTWQSKAIQMS